MSWHRAPMTPFDLETTGRDPHTARIVEAAVLQVGDGRTQASKWLVRPDGYDIPDEAVKIHGISTAQARADGRPGVEVLDEILADLALALRGGRPIVGHNVSYDLAVVEAEAVRYGLPGLAERLDGQICPVLDTCVMDRYLMPFRRRPSADVGPYTLATSAHTYKIAFDASAAHGAEYDALVSARIAYRMAQIANVPSSQRPDYVKKSRSNRFSEIADMTLPDLHAAQARWHTRWAGDLTAYKMRKWQERRDGAEQRGEAFDEPAPEPVDHSWPIQTRPEPERGVIA